MYALGLSSLHGAFLPVLSALPTTELASSLY